MLASGFLAVGSSGELDLPTTVVTVAVLLLRALMIAGIVRLQIPQALINVVLAAIVLSILVSYWWFSHSVIAATIHLIFAIAVVKLLTAKTMRDYLHLKIIAALELLTAALYSTHISFFLFLGLFVFGAIAASASGEMVRSLQKVKQVSTISLRAVQGRLLLMSVILFTGIFLMTGGLFFVLPRTARAAMQRFTPPHYHLAGFGPEVNLGDLGELKQNSTSVMHVKSYTDQSLDGLYWRGSTLSHFDGSRWSTPFQPEQRLIVQDDKLLLIPPAGVRPGTTLGYSVELNDLAPDVMFFAGIPQTISIRLRTLFRSPAGTIRAPRLGIPVLRYETYSLIEQNRPSLGPPVLSASERHQYLNLPAVDSRVAALARSWIAGERDPRRMVQAIESHLQREFRYSLEISKSPVADPVASFLFERKQGHCEYFASSMAVMLRTIGIPSRVVTGFYGGVFNPISGWHVLRASDAHSWVEAWLPRYGWMAFDPTPADIAAKPSHQLVAKAEFLLDAAEQFWRNWVLSYDLNRQVTLASQMQTAGRKWQADEWILSNAKLYGVYVRDRARSWVALAATISLIVLAILLGPTMLEWWNRRQRLARAQRGEIRPHDATLIYERMLSLLEQGGWKRAPWLTPREFAETLPPSSELALLVEDLTASYNQVRFGGRSDVAPRMARLLRRVETLLA